MRQFSAARCAAALLSIVLLGIWTGCGGTSSASSGNTASSITMIPSTVSMNVGTVAKVTGVTKNSSGSVVVADVSYTSDNPAQITVSPTGEVCAGQWDSNFITCKALPGKTGVATATITAKTGSLSATAPVFAHLQVDQISVNPPTGCASVGATPTYTATAYNTTAPGCSVAVPCDITPSVGPISFYSTDIVVMTNNATTGVLTAVEPGLTSIYASVSGLNSLPQSALVCPVVSIKVHDASSSNTAFTLAPTNTQDLVADVIDSAGNSIRPSLAWSSTPLGAATVSLGTSTTTNSAVVTAIAQGTAIITATCSTPDCNRNVSPQYSQNLATVTVSGTTTTTVYAASTKSTSLMPISSSTNTAGTAITLPYLPNSIMTNSGGTKVYLGSANGMMTVDTTSSVVAIAATAPGKVLAVSPAGEYVLISDSVNGYVYLYANGSSAVAASVAVTATAAAFTPDGKSVTFLTPSNELYYITTYPTSNYYALPYTAQGLAISAQGGLTYVTTTSLGGIDILSTCNHVSWQTLAATAPTLIAQLPNGNGAVAADPPGIDYVTSGTVPAGCPPAVQSTVNTYDLGKGSFTPTQVFVSPDSTSAWILASDQTSVLGLNLTTLQPFAVALANGAKPTTGGIMINNATVYVGGTDNNVHAITVSSLSDSTQIAPGLKDSSSNVVAPDLVVVLPK